MGATCTSPEVLPLCVPVQDISDQAGPGDEKSFPSHTIDRCVHSISSVTHNFSHNFDGQPEIVVLDGKEERAQLAKPNHIEPWPEPSPFDESRFADKVSDVDFKRLEPQTTEPVSPPALEAEMTPMLVPHQASIPEVNLESLQVCDYGCPISPEEAQELLPGGDGGISWQALLTSEDWHDNENFTKEGEIRQRRPALPVRVADFFSSLVKTKDGRWVFSGVLNGWPGLTCLEVHSIVSLEPEKEKNHKLKSSMSASFWQTGDDNTAPSFPSGAKKAQAILRMAPWTARGWSRESPGFVWWYFAQNQTGPQFAFGKDIQRMLERRKATGKPVPQAVAAHVFAHRYALGGRREDRRERITYHTAVLVEWDHGLYCSVVELGPLNGISARYGRSDWYPDKHEATTGLSQVMPDCLVMPWKEDKAEIRVSDVAARDLAEFKGYVAKYTGHMFRFVDPQFQHSGQVRLSYRSQSDIARYLLSYMTHDQRFAIQFRSCQSFAADFYAFLVGEFGIEPFHPSLRKHYVRHCDWFLYEPRADHDKTLE
mmetsp:Transcript_17316/g.40637  ORF Transcript_17316/g.40637 Transcript_17316/m.40637 type:complete len:540 (-) Transcript_17316:273-1892(-)|eukprot:CAMPEP_0171065010 /NCGR_PEP_ID=MMETSP0766_2-20121228/6608_1 /TAXON_ID=439317 /ORGANISM="Gambierdiscus australes, Strain CAWD 149" /LENGTH=539 /DNA_ID=CAMNT_0011521081 /DNA_START=60 /DNA_END=1679 /DNA_ORIENTATION=+